MSWLKDAWNAVGSSAIQLGKAVGNTTADTGKIIVNSATAVVGVQPFDMSNSSQAAQMINKGTTTATGTATKIVVGVVGGNEIMDKLGSTGVGSAILDKTGGLIDNDILLNKGANLINNYTGNSSTGVTTQTMREQVRQAYLQFLGREPDASGWDHWTAVANTSGIEAVRSSFLNSQEYKNRQMSSIGTNPGGSIPTVQSLTSSISAPGQKATTTQTEEKLWDKVVRWSKEKPVEFYSACGAVIVVIGGIIYYIFAGGKKSKRRRY